MTRDKLNGLLGGDTVVMKASDISALKSLASSAGTGAVLSKAQRATVLAARSQARKEKMMKKAKSKKTTSKVGLKSKPKNTNLQRLKDTQHDDVKHMDQILLYASCATIRDRQLLEKKQAKQREIDEDARLHNLMEGERVRGIQMLEERERVRARRKKEDAEVVRQQIARREKERMIKKEKAEQEAEAMLERIKENQRREEDKIKRKIEHSRKLHEEVLAANDAAARVKLRAKELEIEEHERIAAYVRSKERREAAEEARLAEIKAAKDFEIARLRANQEKANDRRGEMDALRAKRYQEASDRKWRLAEKEKALKKQEMLRDLSRVRKEQQMYKTKYADEQRKVDNELQIRTLMWQREQQAKDDMEAERKRLQRVSIQNTVLGQIKVKEAARKQKFKDYRKEGNHIKKAIAEERARITRIKQEKLDYMTKTGVPEKFRSELAKKKILANLT